MTKEEKTALVAECRASGMTAREWCRLKGIKYTQYCGWATRVNREAQKNEEHEWADVTVVKKDCNNNVSVKYFPPSNFLYTIG